MGKILTFQSTEVPTNQPVKPKITPEQQEVLVRSMVLMAAAGVRLVEAGALDPDLLQRLVQGLEAWAT